MSDSNVSLGSGIFSTLWLISLGVLWAHPASFPPWVFDLCNIIFWIGLIPMIIIAVVLVIVIIVKVLE
jgi:hypothetical protein